MLKIDSSDHWEKEKVKHHPRLGYELVKSISLWNDSAEIILYHHERYDGTGYPMAKKEEEIPLPARILAVADTFDVLTSNYSYNTRLDYDVALKEIEAHAGTQFDPVVVQALKSAITDAGVYSLNS
jgi:HD-GYP domain-containing protein (c-di-GMP phosphodiesterase class II)